MQCLHLNIPFSDLMLLPQHLLNQNSPSERRMDAKVFKLTQFPGLVLQRAIQFRVICASTI